MLQTKILLKAFRGMYIPMNSPKQHNISFSISVFVALKNQISAYSLKTSNCIIENLSII